MALIWTESFDGPQTTTKYSSFSGSLVIDSTAGRNGKGVRTTGNSTSLAFITPNFSATDEDDVIIVGFALKYRTAPSQTHIICTLDNGTNQGILRVSFDFKLQLVNGSGTVLAETPTPVLGVGSWYYVELKQRVHDTLGTMEVRTNGVTRAQVTNADTKLGSATTINGVTFYINQQSSSVTELNYIDDIYICNEQGASFNDFLGDVRIEGLTPNGNGNSSQWVGSDADSTNNYLLVSDTSDATYVEGLATGDKDTYAYSNLVGSTGTVLGVNMWFRANVDVLPRQVIPVSRLSATEADGTAKNMTATIAWYSHLQQTKPGGGAWSLSDVDNAEFGQKVGT